MSRVWNIYVEEQCVYCNVMPKVGEGVKDAGLCFFAIGTFNSPAILNGYHGGIFLSALDIRRIIPTHATLP